MTIDYSSKGLAKVTMVDYVKDIVSAWDKAAEQYADGFKAIIRKSSGKPTVAPSNVFVVDEESMKLSEAQKAAFHNIVAKALYVAKRSRPDIAVAISFLTTRVRNPDIQDWGKLRRPSIT